MLLHVCVFFYTYGNILRDELRDLFSPERSEKFKKLPSPNVEYCGNCEELENCQQCPARAYDAKNNNCRWKKDFIEIMENKLDGGI